MLNVILLLLVCFRTTWMVSCLDYTILTVTRNKIIIHSFNFTKKLVSHIACSLLHYCFLYFEHLKFIFQSCADRKQNIFCQLLQCTYLENGGRDSLHTFCKSLCIHRGSIDFCNQSFYSHYHTFTYIILLQYLSICIHLLLSTRPDTKTCRLIVAQNGGQTWCML